MVMERGLPMITIGSDTAACPKQSHIPALEDLVSQITDEVGPDSFPAVHPDSTLTIPFSSGTTGLPKGVVLSHRNVTSNMLQLRIVEGDMSQKRLLNPLPFFHIYGLVCGLIYPVFACMPTVFMPSFDFVKCLEIIQKHKITSASLVPPIVLALAKHPLVDQYDLSSLERIGCGAAPLGSEIQHAAAKRLKCVIKQGWGMTELSPVGTVVPDAEANNMEELKGKVMQGYYKNPEATAATIRPDGFMHTGDIGFFDDMGWLQITDRIKELIKYKGFQVAPAELE
ncbi:4CL, partial [Symbiodinium microadriaticum]